MEDAANATTLAVDPRDVSYAHALYALYALAMVIGFLTVTSIAIRYVFGAPSIVALVMNYLRRDKVRGTWLASHFIWQRRTFWWAFGWVAVIWLVCGPFALILIVAPMKIGYSLVGIWVAYRVARGWLALKDARTMPVLTP